MLAFIAAVAFATIVAVVAGLTLAAASALAHDVYVGAMCGGEAPEREQVIAARLATLIVGMVAIGVSILARGQNVVQLVGLAYAVAASANLPALVLTLYWKRCTTQGVLMGIIGGTLAAVTLVLVSPNMTYPALVRDSAQQRVLAIDRRLLTISDGVQRSALQAEQERAITTVQAISSDTSSIVGLRSPLVTLRNPGIISIPIGFLLVILVSLFTRDSRAEASWPEMVVRRETGYGIAAPNDH